MKTPAKRLYLVYSLNTSNTNQSSIHPGKHLYFSSQENAESVIRSYKELYPFLYDDEIQGEHLYCLVMEEFELDNTYRYQLSTRVYSPEGELLCDSVVPDDGPFLGRPEHTIYHEIGEVVEIPYGDKLIFGIVIEKPLCFNEDIERYAYTASDDCYTVIHHDGFEINYAFAPLVFKPTRIVSEKIREDLLSAYLQVSENEKSN